jgi:hypothetical protein
MDFAAIAAALAARYAPGAPGVVTPTGARAIRSSTANLPNDMPATPAVLVLPDMGSMVQGNGSRLAGSDWMVRLHYDQVAGGSMDRDQVALLAWLGVLVDVLATDSDLGGTVTVARTVSWKVGILRWSQVDYSGLEIRVHTVHSSGFAVSA